MKAYHDTEYGFPIQDDDRLFERFILEINQAGLSWITILKKRDAFLQAFDEFSIQKVSEYGESEINRLMSNAGIIRNKRKIEATIENAIRIRTIQNSHGSWKAWLDQNSGKTLSEWARLFKETFVFTGSEIVREFLISSGYLESPHDPDCPVYQKIARLDPPWMKAAK
jgi:DNA-3-methyladenine glycosylase I